MKKILSILFLVFLALPVFSAVQSDGFDYDNDRDKPIKEYYTKLYNAYMTKVDKGEIDCSDGTFTKYVMYPTIVFKENFDKEHGYVQFPFKNN